MLQLYPMIGELKGKYRDIANRMQLLFVACYESCFCYNHDFMKFEEILSAEIVLTAHSSHENMALFGIFSEISLNSIWNSWDIFEMQ